MKGEGKLERRNVILQPNRHLIFLFQDQYLVLDN